MNRNCCADINFSTENEQMSWLYLAFKFSQRPWAALNFEQKMRKAACASTDMTATTSKGLTLNEVVDKPRSARWPWQYRGDI